MASQNLEIKKQKFLCGEFHNIHCKIKLNMSIAYIIIWNFLAWFSGQEICLIRNVNTHRNALHIERIRTHVQKHWIKVTVGFINCFWMICDIIKHKIILRLFRIINILTKLLLSFLLIYNFVVNPAHKFWTN